ncbi:hypothetical protein NYE54_09205 [Paenibacillus sp. FSL K6-1330]|uniref:hypothetical protein n=1 Tax=Paenibacillus sp. FSL K6-1330 TaxID=2975292 RepID=UPI0030D97F0E
MTAIIGFTTGLFSIILTDNRINWGMEQEYGYEDGQEKLFNIPEMGWAGGAGLSLFINDFKKSLAEEKVSEVQNIIDIFKNSVDYSKNEAPEYSEVIDESVAIASWIGATEAMDKILFRVGVLSKKHFGNQMGLLNENEIFVVYPPEYLRSIEKVRELEERYKLKIEHDFDLSEILIRMLHIFNEISQNSKFVSTTCDVGLQFMAEEGLIKAKISGEITKLINKLENGDVSSCIEIINVIGPKISN